MKNNNIKCTVANCTFWDDKYCTASAIEVNVDSGGMEASNEKGTMCHTFKNRS